MIGSGIVINSNDQVEIFNNRLADNALGRWLLPREWEHANAEVLALAEQLEALLPIEHSPPELRNSTRLRLEIAGLRWTDEASLMEPFEGDARTRRRRDGSRSPGPG